MLYQSHIHPPHFEVVYAHSDKGTNEKVKEVWKVAQGRNNLFHALILFAHCVKTNLDGCVHFQVYVKSDRSQSLPDISGEQTWGRRTSSCCK
jgi:hypothetical protein